MTPPPKKCLTLRWPFIFAVLTAGLVPSAIAIAVGSVTAGAAAGGGIPITKLAEVNKFGIGNIIRWFCPTSDKRVKAWKNSLKEDVNKFESECRKRINGTYEQIFSQLQYAVDESSKEMRKERRDLETCVTKIDECSQALRGIEDSLEQLVPG